MTAPVRQNMDDKVKVSEMAKEMCIQCKRDLWWCDTDCLKFACEILCEATCRTLLMFTCPVWCMPYGVYRLVKKSKHNIKTKHMDNIQQEKEEGETFRTRHLRLEGEQ